MKYYTTQNFIKMAEALPPPVRRQALDKYELLKSDPRHLSEHLKRAGNLWSVQLNADFRLLGAPVSDGIVWFWIGSRKKS